MKCNVRWKKVHKNVKMNFKKSERDEADGRKKHEFSIVIKKSMRTCAFRWSYYINIQ